MSINVFPPVSSGGGGSLTSLFSRVDLIDSSGTWDHPDGYASPRIIAFLVIAGGGGGGSGAALRNASGHVFSGGGGGGGTGGFLVNVFRNTSTLTITVGAGGAGGNGVTATTSGSDGLSGAAGGTSSIVENSVTIATCSGGGAGLRGQAAFGATAVTLNATTYYLGGAGGSPSGLSGGNGGFTSTGLTSGVAVNATSGAALTNIFEYFLVGLNETTPFPKFTLNQTAPSGGPGGGTTFYNGTVRTCLEADGLVAAPDLYNLAVPKAGSESKQTSLATTLTSDNGPDADLNFTYGGGGGGSGGVWRFASSGSNLLTSGRGGNGGDGAVWIFY